MKDRINKHAQWDDRVRRNLAARASDPGWTEYVLALWQQHLNAGFVHDHFVTELTKGEDGPFFQRIWEMMVGRHMLACGYDVTSPAKDGQPDFRCSKDGHVTWVEAICITAGEDPALAPNADWLRSSGYVPHDNILLRWANALDAKIRQAQAHRAAGAIATKDSYLIAINGGLITAGNYGFGVSRYPFVVEITLAVGALQFSFDRETLALRSVSHQARTHTMKANKSPVPTTAFLDRKNAGISALVGCGSIRVPNSELPLLVVHNPFAECPIPVGSLGTETREWVAKPSEQDSTTKIWKVEEVASSRQ